MDQMSLYRNKRGESLLHTAIAAFNKDAVDMLTSNGFNMYQAKTQGLQKLEGYKRFSDCDETIYQIVTPLDSLLQYDLSSK